MTLNEVIARIITIAGSHKQIKAYEHGNVVDILQKDTVYPCLISDLNTATISSQAKQTSHPFSFWLCSLANVAEGSKKNEIEVQSDLLLIAQDLVALFRSPDYSRDWTISENVPVQLLREEMKDVVIGVKFDITIQTRFDSNRCQVPTNVSNVYPSSGFSYPLPFETK